VRREQRYGNGDRSYQELLFAYFSLTGRKFTAANTMTRQIATRLAALPGR